jgi:tetratricopeptide (TPR) repeat protein
LALQSLVEKFREKQNQSIYKWKMALVAAQSDPEQNWFYQLSNIAGRAGNRDEQMEALFRAITHEKGVPPRTKALTPLFQWLAEKNEEEKLLAVSERLLKREPNHPLLLNNYLYLKALYRSAAPQDGEVLAKLVEAHPDNIAFRRSLAFVQLMLREGQKALTTLESLEEKNDSPDHSVRAIRARALFSLGKEQEGREIAETVDWSQLNPKEQRVLKLPEPEEEEEAQEEK